MTSNIAVRLAVIDGQKVKAELRDVGETGQRALKRVEDASRPASKALQALDGAARDTLGSLEGMTGRLGPLGGALARLGPAGIAAGAALAAVSVSLVKGVRDAAEYERTIRRMDSVLKATGYAAGLTSRQISAVASELEIATLTSMEKVHEAAAVLATFRTVAGDTFTRTLHLAQDMSTVFGQDLSASVTQLGKALEDPIQGLTALRRVGISFSQSQRDLIQSLMDTGQQAEAQRIILDALERQVGGAGAAEAQGLTGATNRLSDAWGNVLKQLGGTPAIVSVAQNALARISNAIETVTGLLQGRELAMVEGRLTLAPDRGFDAQIAEREAKLVALRKRVEDFGGPLGDLFGMEAPAALKAALAEQERALAELQRRRDDAAATARTEEEKARAGRLAAEADARAERLTALRDEIEKGLAQHATAAEKRAAIDKAYADKRRQIEALRTGENASEIDATLAREAELHRRQSAALDATEAKRGAADARRAAAAEKAAAMEAARNARVVDEMGRQLDTLADKRQQSIDQALSRLSAGATAAQRAEVEKLAGALYDQKEALEAKAEAEREGLRVAQQLMTPMEVYAGTLARLKVLLDADAISQEAFNRAVANAGEELAAGQDRLLRQSREWRDGARVALGDYVDEATNAARGAEEAMTIAFQGMEDALTSMVVKGKLDFGSLADSIVADITRIAIKQAILAPLANAMMGSSMLGGTAAAAGSAAATSAISASVGSAAAGAAGEAASAGWMAGMGKSLGGWLASWFHEGGVVGRGAPKARIVDPALFFDAPRYHTGGYPGLKADEVPAILQRGERVLSRRELAADGIGRRAAPMRVVMNITTPDAASFRASQGQVAADAARTLARVQRRHL